MERRQDLYLSIRKLSNLSPFGNLFHSVFFSVDLIFRRKRLTNITRAVAGNPRFHLVKTVFCWTAFDTPFQITIMRSYRTAMVVFYASWNLKFPVQQFFLFIYFLKRQPHEHGYFRAIQMTPPYSYTVWPALWKFSSIATVLLSVPFSPVCVFIHL